MKNISIRPEDPAERSTIRRINEQAFDQPAEAGLVDALRDHGAVTLSLVAERDGDVVGHILFSPAHVVGEHGEADAVALAPMSVLPEYQGTGIGTAMVSRGLEMLREAGHGLVIVLGHPGYYPRFGFVPATRFGIRCPFEVPSEAFLAMELREGAAPAGGGVVRYRSEFSDV
jgi:putative acetyltransferase